MAVIFLFVSGPCWLFMLPDVYKCFGKTIALKIYRYKYNSMSRKKKGINAERELIHLFWANDWMPIRVAGSGSAPIPCPDIIASNRKRKLAIECKTSKSQNLYVNKKDIEQLKDFCERFDAECWLGIRFNREEWLFLPPHFLEEKKTKFLINAQRAKEKGVRFNQLIEQQV
ncbi:hypothetical protein GF371_05085 [Candidatus Woesearchaeota archaeon]|nr:hypothetical protein [Candidatus Woesearchaeota archaeon]